MKRSMKLSMQTVAIATVALFAVAAEPAWGETKAEQQKEILQQVSSGKDARALMQKYRAAYPTVGSPYLDHSVEVRQYNQAEEALIDALQAQSGKKNAAAGTQAASAYAQWKATLAIIDARNQSIAKQIDKSSAGQQYQSRHQAAIQAFAQRNSQVQQLLDPVLDPGAQKSAGQGGNGDPFSASLKLLQSNTPHPAARILKASNLPVGSLNLATRAPVMTPVVVPSYAAGTEIAATQDDSASTTDAPLSNDIIQQASSLGNDYVKVYEYVRNSVKTQWYAGSVRGAVGTFRSGAGNDVDQASLLIALLRASSVPARYVHGVVELPVGQVAASLGLADSSQVPAALTKAGIAFTPVAHGGSIAVVQIEHTWVSALVPYTNYRGAMVDSSGKTWIPLDPSYKAVVNKSATANESAAGGASTMANAYLGQVETLDFGDYVANQVTSALQKTSGAVNYQAALGSQSVTALNLSLLPNSLPYTVDAVTREGGTLGAADLVQVEVNIQSAGTTVLDTTLAMNDVGNQRLTLSYTTATPEDDKLMLSFGGLDSVPLYLIKLRPQLKVDGQVRIAGSAPVDPGSDLVLTFTVTGPFGSQQYSQTVMAGAYQAIELGGATATRPAQADPADDESTAAHLLDGVGVTYNQTWTAGEQQFAALTGVAAIYPAPSVALVTNQMTTTYLNGVPQTLTWQGVTIDALGHPVEAVTAAAGGSAADFMQMSALHGSSLEATVFENQFQVESISADKGLEIAHAQNIPILTLTSANIGSLAATNHSTAVQSAIANLVNQGYTVDVPNSQITDLDWTGSTWRARDPASGAAGYFISGNLAGGATGPAPDAWTLDFLADALRAPNSAPFDTDPASGTQLLKVGAGDNQTGTVNQQLPNALSVKVLDVNNSPVLGASVTFTITAGGGTLATASTGSGAGSGGTSVTATTDQTGIASVMLTLGQQTSNNPRYTMVNPGDTYPTQVGWTTVDVSAVGKASSPLTVDVPFSEVAQPDSMTQLKQISQKLAQTPPTGISGFYQGSAGTWVDSWGVEAEDQFGNPIANANIIFTISSQLVCKSDKQSGFKPGAIFNNQIGPNGQMIGCSVSSPVLGSCGSAGTSETTGSLGTASVGVLLSNDPTGTNTVDAVSDGVFTSTTYNGNGTCGDPATQPTYVGMIQGGGEIINAQGTNISAAKLSTQFGSQVTATLFASNYQYETRTGPNGPYIYYFPYASFTKTTGSVNFTVSNGGSATNTGNDGNGGYFTNVMTGPTPAVDVVSAAAQNVDVKVPQIVGGLTQVVDSYLSIPSTALFNVYAVDPKIVQLQSAQTGGPVSIISLDANNNSAVQLALAYQVSPSQYTSATTEFDLFDNGTWVNYFTGSSLSGSGTAVLPRGLNFNPNDQYQAQLVLNRGSQVEMRSSMFDLPLKQKLLISASNPVRASTEVDVANKRVCDVEGDLNFVVTQPVYATLTATPVDSNGNATGSAITIFSNQSYPSGSNDFSVDATSGSGYVLGTGVFQYSLSVVAQADSTQTDSATGNIYAIAQDNYQLPVGQILVKGVNVKTGALVAQSEEISVPGRGPALRFQPTYSSGARGAYDPMGINWTHNFESNIHINKCGDVIVSGGDGGGAHFFPKVVNGVNTLVPDRGYHSTLVQNTSDYSFDFYSKDGTRYHYTFFARTKDWKLTLVQDTNGNTQTLNYDMNAVPVPLLVNVTDSNGRQLNFTYALQPVQQPIAAQAGQPLMAEVSFLKTVTGPGGLEMDFVYDTLGNLTSINRNGRVETFAYAENAPWYFDRGMLTNYTDPNGNVTSYTYNPQSFTVSPSGAFVLTVPYSFVTSVKTPIGTLNYTIDTANFQKPSVTNENGNVTSYNLNVYGNPLSITDPAGTTSMTWATDDVLMLAKTDARGVTTNFTYDSAGNQTSATVGGASTQHTYLIQSSAPYIKNRVTSVTDRNGNTTTYELDNNGNVTAESKPEGVTVKHVYAGNGDRLSTTDGNGGVTQYTYDAGGEVLVTQEPSGALTTLTRDARERVMSSTDADGNPTSFTYDAQDRVIKRTDALGFARSMTYDNNGNKLSEKDENGNTTQWTYNGVNLVATEIDAAGDSKSYSYDPVGNKIGETDFRGNTTSYTYDGVNRLLTRVEPLGKTTSYQYDQVGNVTQETDALGRVTTHTYDDLSRRIGTVDAAGGTWVLGYDQNGNKILNTDANGNSTSYTYDGLNRLTSTVQPLGRTTAYTYDHNNNKLTETDPNGNVTKYVYDVDDRLLKLIDGNGFVTTHSYDPQGNLVQTVDARLSVTKYTYDALNRKSSMTDGEGYTTGYEYDKVGNLIQETLPNGNVNTHSYDSLDRLLSTTDNVGNIGAWSYDADGNKLTETDGNGNTASHTYNALNQLTVSQLPAGRSVTYTLDLLGNITDKIDLGTETTYTYDALNRVTKDDQGPSGGGAIVQTYDAVGNKLSTTDRDGNVTTFKYDALNRLTLVTDPLGKTIATTYDLVGNKLTLTDKRGVTSSYTYDKVNRPLVTKKDGVVIDTKGYDEVGNQITSTDANGNSTTYVFDKRDLMIQNAGLLGAITNYTLDAMGDKVKVTDPEGRVTTNSYDARRRLVATTDPAGETTKKQYDLDNNLVQVTRPLGNATVYAYDAADRLTQVTDGMGGNTVYSYDTADNHVGVTDADGNKTAYSYDKLHRRTGINYPDGASESFTYDYAGNMLTHIDGNGMTTTRSFDKLNRETSKSYSTSADGTSAIATGYDANNNVVSVQQTGGAAAGTISYSYDNFDRRQQHIDAFGAKVNITYDANGNKTSLITGDGKVTRYSYDTLNRLIGLTGQSGTITYGYDKSSLNTSIGYSNGVTSTMSYDAASRVATVIHATTAGNFSRTDYQYDHNGNRTKETINRSAGAQATAYAFDNDDRLTQTTLTTANETVVTTYTLDAVGNRKGENIVTTPLNGSPATVNKTYTYSSRNELISIADDSAGNTSLKYDKQGNLIEKDAGSDTTLYTYNAADNLTQIAKNGTVLGAYGNDYLGLRVLKTATDPLTPGGSAITKTTLWDGRNAFLDSVGGNVFARYESDGRHPVSEWSAEDGVQELHHDALGSIVATTDSTGALKSENIYDAYGNIETQTGQSSNKFGYTGHQMDQESGLIYFQARYYDPTIGMFITQDPYEGQWDTPMSLHHYLYAYANPTVYIDLNGNKSIFGDATEQLENFKSWLGERNKQSNSTLAAIGIGTAQFVTSLGEGITRPLDVTANLAQVAAGVDDDQVRKELAGTKEALTKAKDFVVHGDYKAAAKNVYNKAVEKTTRAMEGDVTATAEVTQDVWGIILMKDQAKQAVESAAKTVTKVAKGVSKAKDALRDAMESRKTPPTVEGQRPPSATGASPEDTLTGEKPNSSGTGEKKGPVKQKSAEPAKEAEPDPTPCPRCFAAGTLVATPEGYRTIESIKVGDVVWSKRDDNSGEPFAAAVTATHVRTDQPIYVLAIIKTTVEGRITEDVLHVTPSHPFWVEGKSTFVQAGELQPGDQLQSRIADGSTLTIKSMTLERPIGTTYNLTINVGHTFYVGQFETWVHNTGDLPCGGGRVPVPGDADFVGPVPKGGWRLTPKGEGAHLVEKSNVRGREGLQSYDKPETPRYYPKGSAESAGEAHRRLHVATKAEGIKLKGGNPKLSDEELMDAYRRAYSSPDVQGIRGDVRTPTGKPIPGGENVPPSDAFDALKEHIGGLESGEN